MRIMIAHSEYRLKGGEDRYVEQQAALLSRDHSVELLLPDNKKLSHDLNTAKKMFRSRAVENKLIESMRSFTPDVVHVHNAYPALGPAVHLAAARCDIPIVMTVHNYRLRCPNGYFFTEGDVCTRCEGGNYSNAIVHDCFPDRSQATAYAASLWWHRFGMKLHRKVDAFIAPSEFMSRQLRHWGVEPERIHLLRNFTPVRAAASSIGTAGLFAGRLSAEKGLFVLLDALRACGDPPFTIAGSGPLLEPLRQRALSLGLQNLDFKGQVEKEALDVLFDKCRFLVLPSLSHDNAPLVALQAMMAGKPLVVTERGGLPELVRSESGLTVPAGNQIELSQALARFFSDDELCRAAGANGRRFALSRCSPESHAQGLVDIYKGTLAKARAQ